MKIAIHEGKGFTQEWIKYCKSEKIEYKLVNCYSNNIIYDLEDCDVLMWHFHHENPKDILFAKQLLYSVQTKGKTVFPDFNTSWHFDDKIGQKYLLEAIGAPLVPTYVFFSKEDCMTWLKNTSLPKVFKLRNGASSKNVKLIKTKKEAIQIISRAFKGGFKSFDKWEYFNERFRKYQEGLDTFLGVIKGFVRLFIVPESFRAMHKQKGYVYFQDFIPKNDFDSRVIVIVKKAFAIRRLVRKGDFRASGSGKILYDNSLFDTKTLEISFSLAKTLKSQCVAIDFVYENGEPLITEISYGFAVKGYRNCRGYWDSSLHWHEGEFNPYGWMIEELIKEAKTYKS